jgi:RHH-type transcriptional regulator, proline utilization regulon repressor / proline dehydrogenase / delta 1-pyrroline-5-carboxylate dehydrogenase
MSMLERQTLPIPRPKTDAPAPPPPSVLRFAPRIGRDSELRQRIAAACRRAEPDVLPDLIEMAALPPAVAAAATEVATSLVTALRGKHSRFDVAGLVREYSLSSQEGLALMCVAEALLRIPDHATRDALIRDKIGGRDWTSHLGSGRSLFVNAATTGLVIAGAVNARPQATLAAAFNRLVERLGRPLIRRAIETAMAILSQHFVAGQTIEQALANARPFEAKGFRYSYDMLGEAAMTADDAERYNRDYETSIYAIGRVSVGRGVRDSAGISIKLSALHPRFSRAQSGRARDELLPRLKHLAALSRHYDIGINIDAEEVDRVDLSLDLLEALAEDPDLAGWDGLGFVVQAYGKRCPYIIDFIVDLARRHGRRMMVRLVKGAYWDAEIKRAQIDGLAGFPVYTRKVYSDVSYFACARKLLAARDVIFPQFATHNARTLATVYALAGQDYRGDYEFQCLHGMGYPLYEEVVGAGKLDRPCRVYAPVGTHDTLLPYLVRRLLENGANSSFVNRIADAGVPIAELVADPIEEARAIVPPGAPHDGIALPADVLGPDRRNSNGLDLADEGVLARLSVTLADAAAGDRQAAPTGTPSQANRRPVLNPADHRDRVGTVVEATPEQARVAVERGAAAAARWARTPVRERAQCLRRAADLLQQRMPALLGLICREAGKSVPNAIGEVREAIDFLRYYAAEAERTLDADTAPLGVVACISPWNFPLSIFTGQIAAALVAGNAVIAKPAEETPLVAAEAVAILHTAGIPADALALVPGDGRIGAAVVAHAAISGVMFTGSTEVARLIQATVATRTLPNGRPIPLIAETGGQNAMIADSSALAEQVVADVVQSAFDSAGQRCSALRLLCVQDDAAERILPMLEGAMRELTVGRPDRLDVDVGPVISQSARQKIEDHVAAMAAKGRRVARLALPAGLGAGTFVAPTIIEIDDIAELEGEVFGPVLHVLRYRSQDLDRVVAAINRTGFGLTFGLHTRIDGVIARVAERIRAGNIYINRNIIGAVVGVQPFGGRGLSGTGPKAGGPLYLRRLLANPETLPCPQGGAAPVALTTLIEWLRRRGDDRHAVLCEKTIARTPLGHRATLAGPVGESNTYSLRPRGRVLLLPETPTGLYVQLAAAIATGNEIIVDAPTSLATVVADLPAEVAAGVTAAPDGGGTTAIAAALVEGGAERVGEICRRLSQRRGPVTLTLAATRQDLATGAGGYDLALLVEERATSVNTAAAGGNATLFALG